MGGLADTKSEIEVNIFDFIYEVDIVKATMPNSPYSYIQCHPHKRILPNKNIT